MFERIEHRVECMLQDGLYEEVKGLLDAGVSAQAQSMQGIGYKEMIPVVNGTVSLQQAKEQIILNTRHYAKRQETWFRGEKATVWVDADNALACATETIQTYLAP